MTIHQLKVLDEIVLDLAEIRTLSDFVEIDKKIEILQKKVDSLIEEGKLPSIRMSAEYSFEPNE